MTLTAHCQHSDNGSHAHLRMCMWNIVWMLAFGLINCGAYHPTSAPKDPTFFKLKMTSPAWDLEPARCEITAKRDAHLSNPPTQGLFYFNWDITWRRSTGINSPPSTFGMLIISPRIWNCVCKQALVDVSLGLLTFLHSLSFSKLGASSRLKHVGVSAKTSKFHLRGAESTF